MAIDRRRREWSQWTVGRPTPGEAGDAASEARKARHGMGVIWKDGVQITLYETTYLKPIKEN